MKARKNGRFAVKSMIVSEHGHTYETFQLYGWLDGRRIRQRFKDREAALGEKNRLEVRAANTGQIVARNTRLSEVQLADAEAAISRLGGKPLSEAVEWFLANYRPPTTEKPIEDAAEAFRLDRDGVISRAVVADYRKLLNLLMRSFPGRPVHTIQTAEIEALMKTRGPVRTSWNNLRAYLHAFSSFVRPMLSPMRGDGWPRTP